MSTLVLESEIYTIARCLKELIVNRQTEKALNNIVEWLAESLQIDRCYISQVYHSNNAHNRFTSIYAGYDNHNQSAIKRLQDLVFNSGSFPEIKKALQANECFTVSFNDDISSSLFDFLEVSGLKSLLLIPVFAGNDYWGFIGFGDTVAPRTWRKSKKDLQDLASAIGSTIQHNNFNLNTNNQPEALDGLMIGNNTNDLGGNPAKDAATKKITNGLRKQKEQYEFLIQSLNQVLFNLDSKGTITFLTLGWYKILGYTKEECIGNNLIEYMPEDEIGHFWQLFGNLLSNIETSFDCKMQMVHKNGDLIWVRIVAKSLINESGLVNGVFGNIEDITNNYTEDLLLKESNEKLTTILDNSKEIILTIDLENSRIENVNEAISILGYRPEDWIGHKYHSWNDDQRKKFHELMKLAVKGQLQVANQQISFTNKSQTEVFTFEFSTSIFHFKKSKYLLCVLRDISERVIYEQNISRISEQLSNLVNNIDDVYAIYDLPTQQFEFISNNVETLYGCSAKEFCARGLTWIDIIHIEDLPGVLKTIEQIINTGNKDEFFYRITDARGEAKMILEKVTVSKNEKGETNKLYIVKTDYTHIENIERSFIESERKFRFISENISDFISIHDTDWNFNYASPSVKSILGYDPDQMIGLGGFDLVHPDDLQKTLDDLLQPLVLHHKETQLRYRLKANDGSYKWVETYSKPVLDCNGEITSIISSSRDVTDQVDADYRLKMSEEQYRLLSENSTDMIATYDLDGRFTYVSPSCLQVLGYTSQELVGKSPGTFLPADLHYKNLVESNLEKVVANKEPITYIYKAKTKTNEEKSLEVVVHPIIKNNEVTAIQEASRDVTEREKLLVELEQSLAKERELNELRSMFVSTASHQFRTPLTIIQSGVEIMELYLEDLPDNKQQRFQKQFNKIQGEVERLEFLMSDILLLGRANAARTPFHPAEDDLTDFIKTIIEEKYNNRYPDNRGVLLQIKGIPVPVNFDKKLIAHAVENILSNAYKYSEKGILLTITYSKTKVKISIADKGMGIPEDDVKNLFQPFYRATNTNDINGTGLGLAIVKEFVEKHNGKIFISSKLNKGTTVSVILPIKQKLQ